MNSHSLMLCIWQDWNSVVIVEYPPGCPQQPHELARQVAKDRYWLQIQPMPSQNEDHDDPSSSSQQAPQAERSLRSGSAGALGDNAEAGHLPELHQQALGNWVYQRVDGPVQAISLMHCGGHAPAGSQGSAISSRASAGQVVISGKVTSTSDGGPDWDQVSVMTFPSRAALVEEMKQSGWQLHLADFFLLAAQPAGVHPRTKL